MVLVLVGAVLLVCIWVLLQDESLHAGDGDSNAKPLPKVKSVRFSASRVRSAISLQKLQSGWVQSYKKFKISFIRNNRLFVCQDKIDPEDKITL